MKALIISNIVLALSIVGCSSAPHTKPVLGVNQTLTKDAQVQSQQGDYVVRVSRLNTNLPEYQKISKYGSPFQVTVANLGKQEIQFGPENIQVVRKGENIKPLTTAKLEEIKNKKNRNHAIWAGVSGALSVGIGVLGALSGDPSLAQSSQQQMSDGLELTFKSYGDSTTLNTDSIDALKYQVNNTVLMPTKLKTNQTTSGLVFFENIKGDDVITIKVKTGNFDHVIQYGAIAN